MNETSATLRAEAHRESVRWNAFTLLIALSKIIGGTSHIIHLYFFLFKITFSSTRLCIDHTTFIYIYCKKKLFISGWLTLHVHMLYAKLFDNREGAGPSSQRVGLAIRRSRVRLPLWPLAGFVLGCPELKSSATLVNSQLVASCQLGFLILLCSIWIICF